LLEVILAIAILGTAIAVIGQLMNIGYRAAVEARLRTDAGLLCDTKMAELAAGVLELKSVTEQSIVEAPGWNYTIDVQNGLQLGLLVVTVTVAQSSDEVVDPISMSIVRFMPDPDYEPATAEE
jgi:type II secretory pathway pseudopilin PulG